MNFSLGFPITLLIFLHSSLNFCKLTKEQQWIVRGCLIVFLLVVWTKPWENVSGTNKICWPASSGIVCHYGKALLMSFWYLWLYLTKKLFVSPLLVCLACCLETVLCGCTEQLRGTWSFFLVWFKGTGNKSSAQNLAFLLQCLFLFDLKDLLLKSTVFIQALHWGFGRTSLFIPTYKTDWILVWTDTDRYL